MLEPKRLDTAVLWGRDWRGIEESRELCTVVQGRDPAGSLKGSRDEVGFQTSPKEVTKEKKSCNQWNLPMGREKYGIIFRFLVLAHLGP